MPASATRRWSIPLTALLAVNVLLIGVAFRHVGAAADAEQVDAEAPLIEVTGPELGTGQATDAGATAATQSPTEIDQPEPLGAEAWGDALSAVPPPVVIGDLPSLPSGGGASEVSQPVTATIVAVEQSTATAPPMPSAVPLEANRELLIVNPPATRGVVHFVVNGQVISLAAGEFEQLPPAPSHRVQFHRGDDFGDADQECPSGVFAFGVTEKGWALTEVDNAAAARLIEICVSIEP